MTPFEPEAVRAALGRLEGLVLPLVLIGGIRLPGFSVAADLRLAAEVLQPGGSLAYRGGMHQMLRRMGSAPGVLLSAQPERLLSLALAAVEHRLPSVAMPRREAGPALRRVLRELGCELLGAGELADARGEAARRGFLLVGDEAERDFALGIASAGFELALGLPSDLDLLIAPEDFVAAVEAGWKAGGRAAGRVVGAAPRGSLDSLRRALLRGHRILGGPTSLAVLDAALRQAGGRVGVLLSE
ncbi:MAG: hypothetical protein Fur0037_03590 [Planctomycetota bacterium]